MLELLALLLPIAAASGWYAAKRHYTRKFLFDHGRPLTQVSLEGLDFRIRGRKGEAMGEYASHLEKDYGALEIHLALGNLFRRRGEVEKAIEIHGKLADDASLHVQHRNQAYFELGMDFLGAGLFDRAESVFWSLSKSESHRKPSLQQLLQIYQQEKDWSKAIECTRQLIRIGKTPRGESVAQFLCELAEEAIALGRIPEAFALLAQALSEDGKCVRANLIKARLQLTDHGHDRLLETLRKIESQNPAYLPEILGPAGSCLERKGLESDFVEYLSYLYATYGLPEAAIERANRRGARSLSEADAAQLFHALESKPNLRGLCGVLEWLVRSNTLGSPESATQQVFRILAGLLSELPRFRCTQCGFSGVELHWRCPSCLAWDSARPL